MKYRVYGKTTVYIAVTVSAMDEDEAKWLAGEQLPKLIAFYGNGGMDKLVGVTEDNESVLAEDEIEYTEVELIGEDEEDEEDEEAEEYVEYGEEEEE